MTQKFELRAGTQGRNTTNYDVDRVSDMTSTGVIAIDPETGEEVHSLTHQSFKDECDINTIVKRFGLTGELPQDYKPPVSGDFTNVVDYSTAMQAIADANSRFMEMPPQLRERFENDPQRLMDFLDNDKNREEAIQLGIVNPATTPPRDMVQAVDELKEALTTPKTT